MINPWTFSLFTINLGKSGAPDVEARALDEVGSYGRQLGRVGDVIKVLLAHTDLSKITDAEKRAVAAFDTQWAHIDLLKREAAASKA